jgi:K+ transporter
MSRFSQSACIRDFCYWPILGLSALGIVFGDIGTSPLYTVKTIVCTENPIRVDEVTESRKLAG